MHSGLYSNDNEVFNSLEVDSSNLKQDNQRDLIEVFIDKDFSEQNITGRFVILYLKDIRVFIRLSCAQTT